MRILASPDHTCPSFMYSPLCAHRHKARVTYQHSQISCCTEASCEPCPWVSSSCPALQPWASGHAPYRHGLEIRAPYLQISQGHSNEGLITYARLKACSQNINLEAKFGRVHTVIARKSGCVSLLERRSKHLA